MELTPFNCGYRRGRTKRRGRKTDYLWPDRCDLTCKADCDNRFLQRRLAGGGEKVKSAPSNPPVCQKVTRKTGGEATMTGQTLEAGERR